jgi:hypothetical protein
MYTCGGGMGAERAASVLRASKQLLLEGIAA